MLSKRSYLDVLSFINFLSFLDKIKPISLARYTNQNKQQLTSRQLMTFNSFQKRKLNTKSGHTVSVHVHVIELEFNCKQL